MGRVCSYVAGVVLPVAVALLPASQAAAAEPSLKIGLPENLFNGVPPAVVAPAAKPFQTLFQKQTGLQGEIVIAKDYDDIANQLRNGTLDVAVFHGFEYAWVKQDPKLVPLLITVPGARLEACLVVNVNSKAANPGDLKGNCVAIPPTTKAYCHAYLDRVKSGLPEGCCCPAKLDGHSVEEALDSVASGTCEAALVDAAALQTYQKLKPGVGTQLKILAKSEPFPPAVIVYRKDAFNAQTEKQVAEGMIKGTATPQGRLLTSLWKLKGFAEVTPEYQKELDACLKLYPAPKK